MEKNRKIKYWILKVLSIVVSCALPIYAILEHFPIWTVSYGTARSIGAGGIIGLVVLLVIFRKTVFDFLRDKLKLKHAPPLTIWLVMIICSYILMYINKFLRDLNTVFWMGLIGCAVGMVLTYFAENRYGDKTEDDNG